MNQQAQETGAMTTTATERAIAFDRGETGLSVSYQPGEQSVRVVFELRCPERCLLHWGLGEDGGGKWRAASRDLWPKGTEAFDDRAVRTAFPEAGAGSSSSRLELDLPRSTEAEGIAFVLYFPDSDVWENNGGQDFFVELPIGPERAAREEVERAIAEWDAEPITHRKVYALSDREQLGVAIAVVEGGDSEAEDEEDEGDDGVARVLLVSNATGELLLHWGLSRRTGSRWQRPADEVVPAGTAKFDEQAVRTPFEAADGLQRLELRLDAESAGRPRGLNLVVYDRRSDHWLKPEGDDLSVPLFTGRGVSTDEALEAMTQQIVEGEVGDHSWTLMHRFDLCYDLLEEAEGDPEALSLLYVWLRYSAIRQLDWQRKYNTKPRELAHSQDRLTRRLAQLHADEPEARPWVRLMLSTLGRGGEGQRVRDQILEIMHRNNVKEKHGTWLEQWHQKLHNNTTPDDVAICRAYLAFLHGDGDVQAFDRTLKEEGVSRERLASFERPITIDPEFMPELKDALIGEFESFLKLLKSVHSGTDLETSLEHAAYALDGGLADHLRGLLHGGVGSAEELIDRVSRLGEGRRRLGETIEGETRDMGRRRDLLHLDLGLEAHLRMLIERFELADASAERLIDLSRPVLENLTLSTPDPEYSVCLGDWGSEALGGLSGGDDATQREAGLYGLSVAERTSRAVRDATDRLHDRLQPKAERLGQAFGAEEWTIPIFSEEVVRGCLDFVLSRLLRHLDPLLRRTAEVGGWQVISPGEARGRVEVVEDLRGIQSKRFAEPTVLIADEVAGDEEIPEGVRAVLTRQTPDIVSHVAVRARNQRVLLAACMDEAVYRDLHGWGRRLVEARVTPEGDVLFDEAASAESSSTGEEAPAEPVTLTEPRLEPGVLRVAEFDGERVGSKANSIRRLRDSVPSDVAVPASVALAFGTFESVLEAGANREVAEAYSELVKAVDGDPERTLPKIRETVERLQPTEGLREELSRAGKAEGLTLDADGDASWEDTWRGITRVWASKWTDRAYWSRRRLGIDHGSLRMAVLVQQVVEADYGFVIHTANPVTRNEDELYGELVLGLGETLVGNAPGYSLGFVMDKQKAAGNGGGGGVRVVSFPSKSFGLWGRGLICRSDSNGEDLARYAGAGLYESVLAKEPEAHRVRYGDAGLILDRGRREQLLESIGALGVAVERALGEAQDIEGAVRDGKLYAVQTRPQVGL